MNVKHTPAPWKVGQDKTAIEASGAIIARIFHWANQYTPIHESHANAKLIAAAPDLLIALREAVEIIEGTGLDATAQREAIIKATGESK